MVLGHLWHSLAGGSRAPVSAPSTHGHLPSAFGTCVSSLLLRTSVILDSGPNLTSANYIGKDPISKVKAHSEVPGKTWIWGDSYPTPKQPPLNFGLCQVTCWASDMWMEVSVCHFCAWALKGFVSALALCLCPHEEKNMLWSQADKPLEQSHPTHLLSCHAANLPTAGKWVLIDCGMPLGFCACLLRSNS